MPNSIKVERLQKELQRITNAVFNGKIDDPRLSGIEITRVKISPDLSFLKLYFSDYNQELSENKTIELLNKSSGFIKKQIAGANIMRTIPQIEFEYDNTSKRVEKIDQIFKKLEAEKRNNDYYDDDSDNEYYDDDELDDSDLDYDDSGEEIGDDIDIEIEDIDEDE